MGQQSLFTGIIVISVQAQSRGRGITTEFSEPILNQDFDGDRVRSVIDRLNPFSEEDISITYELGMKASSSLNAKAKARMFARVKNPFEADVADVEITRQNSESVAGLRDYYEVKITIQK